MSQPLPPWTPELAALELLLSVAELGSVGRAASAHRVSQPSASARLDRLERRLGVPLLVRTPRGSTLTPAGEAVAAWARGVVSAARTLTDGVTALRGGRRARLRVAASLTVAEYLVPGWLLALRARRPEVEIAVAVANSRQVCEQVRTGAADVGFVESPEVPADLGRRRVGSDRLALVVAAHHPLAARAAAGLAARDLLDAPLLLREPGSGTRETFLAALRRACGPGSGPARALQLGSTATIIATACAAGGVGVVSARAVAGELGDGRLVELPVADLDLDRPLHLVWLGAAPGELGAELAGIAARDADRSRRRRPGAGVTGGPRRGA